MQYQQCPTCGSSKTSVLRHGDILYCLDCKAKTKTEEAVQMSVEKELKKLNEDWGNAETRESTGFTPLPDGSYTVTILGGAVGLSETSERLQIVWNGVVAKGDKEGKKLKKFTGLDNPVSMSYAKGELAVMGITIPKKMENLPAALKSFFEDNPKGINVEVTVKTPKDSEFTNIYINALSDDDSKDKGKSKSKGKEEPEEDDLDDMSFKELKKYAEKKNIVSVDPDEFDSADDFRSALKKALKKKAEKKSRFSEDD